MKYYFEHAFYAPGISPEIPAGAVEISDEYWSELLSAQSAGKRITAGADGIPIAVEPPQPTLEERKAAAVDQLWTNYKSHQQKYVDPEDLTLATVCAANGSAKGAVAGAQFSQYKIPSMSKYIVGVSKHPHLSHATRLGA